MPPAIINDQIISVSTEETPEPPPPNLTSNFTSIEDWLRTVIQTDQPTTTISNFHFGLFESKDSYVVTLVGMNKYELGNNHSADRIDFEPTHVYYALPAADYQGLKREEVLERLTRQLKAFTQSPGFRQSFMATAKSITTSFSGKIWPQ